MQLVLIGEDGSLRVLQMPLDAAQRGRLELRGLDRVDRAVLVVSGLAPSTTEEARYEYSIKRLQ